MQKISIWNMEVRTCAGTEVKDLFVLAPKDK